MGRYTGPVERLVRATEEVRVGNLESADLPVDSKDEIGILARSFGAMLEELREKAALEQYVASLTMTMGGEAETIAAPGAAGNARTGAEPAVGQLFASRYEIQGILALTHSFNLVGLDHVLLVRFASAAVVCGFPST